MTIIHYATTDLLFERKMIRYLDFLLNGIGLHAGLKASVVPAQLAVDPSFTHN